METELNDREAFRAVFSFRQTLAGLDAKEDPFSDIETLPTFEPKPKAPMPKANEQIEKIAEANGFPSRQAVRPRAYARIAQRRYKTGRNQQINIKATSQVIERLYKMADARRVPLGELLEQAINALERSKPERLR